MIVPRSFLICNVRQARENGKKSPPCGKMATRIGGLKNGHVSYLCPDRHVVVGCYTLHRRPSRFLRPGAVEVWV